MIKMKDPRQNALFDTFRSILSPLAYERLLSGWQELSTRTLECYRKLFRENDLAMDVMSDERVQVKKRPVGT